MSDAEGLVTHCDLHTLPLLDVNTKTRTQNKHKAASWYDVGNEIITAVSC